MKRYIHFSISFILVVVLVLPAGAHVQWTVAYSDNRGTTIFSNNVLPGNTGDGAGSIGDSTWRNNVRLLALSDNAEAPAEEPVQTGSWNWHKIFGWSTVVSALATVITGFFTPNFVHWGLAGLTSALGLVTCINGYYTYHSVLGFSDGSPQYTMHAIMGTIATAGFIATLALADDEGEGSHAAVGSVSGAIFTITIGIAYF